MLQNNVTRESPLSTLSRDPHNSAVFTNHERLETSMPLLCHSDSVKQPGQHATALALEPALA